MLRKSALACSALRVGKRYTATTAAVVQDIKDSKPFSEVPRVRSLPILGTALNYVPYFGKYDRKRMHLAAKSKADEFGSIVWEEISPSFKTLQITDVEDIKKVFQKEGKWPHRFPIDCITYYRAQRPDIFNSDGLFNSNGEEWQEARSQVQGHMMKPKAVHAYLGAMDTVSKDMVERTAQLRGKNGGEIQDYISELYKWALESVGLVALDTRLGCMDLHPNKETMDMITSVNTCFESILKLLFISPAIWKRIEIPLYKKFARSMDSFTNTCHKYIALAHKRLETLPEDHEATFLEMLLTTNKDPRHITSTITDMFFAGIDTTSTTVGMTLYHLGRNPEAQEKLYQEIKGIQDSVLTADNMNNIRYLKACVKEGMRLTPVVNGTTRNLSEDIVLGGYLIPAGTVVIMQGILVGWSDKYFPEPEKFKPERFMREEQIHDPFAFIPFGFGPRSCVGRRIAEQEIWSLLIRILQRFRVEYNHEEIGLLTRLINMPDKPLRFNFYDR